MTPLLLDIFCGRGGWTRPALLRGWRCTGIDIIDHGYPAQLILQAAPFDVQEIRARNPQLVLASPPCEEFARYHLPWIAQRQLPSTELLEWSISLIGKVGCPMIVECSRFAARHVPGARFTGSYALWGDLPTLLPDVPRTKMKTSGTDAARRAMIHPVLSDWILSRHE
jgi:hypothetical protein